jgi:hypothetical protein
MKEKQFKTVKVCTDELMNQMSRDGWQVQHLQFDGDVLRGVFYKFVETPKQKPVTVGVVIDADAVKPVEVVVNPVGTNPDMYRVPPMNIPYPQNLKPIRPTVDEEIERLNGELMSKMQVWFDSMNTVDYVPRPLGQLVEVNS